MILVWNDSKSFSRHLENMRCFCAGNGADGKCGWDIIKDMPVLRDVRVPPETGGTRSNLEDAGPGVVPLWKFTLPTEIKN